MAEHRRLTGLLMITLADAHKCTLYATRLSELDELHIRFSCDIKVNLYNSL